MTVYWEDGEGDNDYTTGFVGDTSTGIFEVTASMNAYGPYRYHIVVHFDVGDGNIVNVDSGWSSFSLNHDFTREFIDDGDRPASDATCTEPAKYFYYCSRCRRQSRYDTYDVGNPLGHVYTTYVPKGDADCTKDGTKTATCDRCGIATETIADVGTKLGHNTDGKVNAVPATCTTDGVVGGTYCNRCNEGKADAEKPVAALGHSFTKETVNDNCLASKATCTNPARYYYSCSNAGCNEHSTTETFSSGTAPGHSFTNYVSNGDATCTADGTKTATCDRCTATDTIADAGSKLAHDTLGTVAAVAPTCTADGVVGGTYCSRCNEGKAAAEKSIPALGHSFTNYVSNGDATCTADGTKTATCDRCTAKDTITDAGSKLAHDTLGSVDPVEATCSTEGIVGGTYCTRCEEGKAAAGAVIPTLAHRWGAGTLMDDSKRMYVCRDCGTSRKAVVVGFETEHTYTESTDPAGIYPTGMRVYFKYNDNTKAELPKLNDLLTYRGYSLRPTAPLAVRIYTEMDKALREELVDSGIYSWQLIEYGTAVMTKEQYESAGIFEIGAEGVTVLPAFSPDQELDTVFEEVDGKLRYMNEVTGYQEGEELLLCPYATFRSGDDKTITLYGGMINRRVTLAEDENIVDWTEPVM